MDKPKEILEKYFIGFDFSDKEKPTLLVCKHNGKQLLATNYIKDKELVEELYTKLTKKIVNS